jgi:hypothetical protein
MSAARHSHPHIDQETAAVWAEHEELQLRRSQAEQILAAAGTGGTRTDLDLLLSSGVLAAGNNARFSRLAHAARRQANNVGRMWRQLWRGLRSQATKN